MPLHPILDLLASPAVVCWSGLLMVGQRRHPLRAGAARAARVRTNLTLAGPAALTTRLLVIPALDSIARSVRRHQLGVLPRLLPPGPLRFLLSLAALDCGMYFWHRATHQLPVLWRFHEVHHADLGLDVSTALRLHPVELLGSIAARGLQLVVLGVSPSALLSYEVLMQLAALFHHSNIDLGERLDARLSRVLMTPRLHTRHHAAQAGERKCNWGVVSSVWDRLFGSLQPQPSKDGRLGVEEQRAELGWRQLTGLPFRARRSGGPQRSGGI